MSRPTNHPSKWELDWIDDPNHRHHYRDEKHRNSVKQKIVLRTSFRALNNPDIQVVATQDKYGDGRIEKQFVYKDILFSVKNGVSLDDCNFMSAVDRSDKKANSYLLKDETLEIRDLLLKELGGGTIFGSVNLEYSRNDNISIANVFNGLVTVYYIERINQLPL